VDMPRLIETLKEHEGYRAVAYKDSVGVLTIGYGRNLETVGVGREEAELMLRNDIIRAENTARRLFSGFGELNEVRQEVLVNMAFNLGEASLREFVRFRYAVKNRDWVASAAEMKASKWYMQVGERAEILRIRMLTGIY
jgi:lysozyme